MWDDYLGMPIDFSKGHILAYHWKTKEAKGGFNCLVKVNYSKTKPLTIAVYAMIVIALGIIGSAGVTAVTILFPNNLWAMFGTSLFGILLIMIGIFMGRF